MIQLELQPEIESHLLAEAKAYSASEPRLRHATTICRVARLASADLA